VVTYVDPAVHPIRNLLSIIRMSLPSFTDRDVLIGHPFSPFLTGRRKKRILLSAGKFINKYIKQICDVFRDKVSIVDVPSKLSDNVDTRYFNDEYLLQVQRNEKE
jgi:hypothetical protein